MTDQVPEYFVLSKAGNEDDVPSYFDLSKDLIEANLPVPTIFRVGAGWDMPEGAETLDVDLSIASINSDGKLVSPSAFACFKNREVPGIRLSEDSRDGKTSIGGDDEFALINLEEMSDNVVGFIASLSVFDDKLGRNLSAVNDCYIRLIDEATGEEMVRVQMNGVEADAAHLIKVSLIDRSLIATAIEEPISGGINNLIHSLIK